MSFKDDFGDLLPNLVRVALFTGQDHYGGPSYGSEVEVPGRYVEKSKIMGVPGGQVFTSSSFVTIDPLPGLTVEARVKVDGIERTVIAVESASDETLALYYHRIRFA